MINGNKYDTKYHQAKEHAKSLIDKRDTNIKKYVIILDIDDTIYDTKKDKLIEPIFDLYNYALSQNIYTVFITAREGSEQSKKFTVEQLNALGIKGYDLLYLRPPSMKNVYKYKTYARKNVFECGYIPLFSIGDQKWDIGDYGGHGIHIK